MAATPSMTESRPLLIGRGGKRDGGGGRRGPARPARGGRFGLSARVQSVQVREPNLHERPDHSLETRLARKRERLLVALPHLVGSDSLLEAIVARDEELLDPLPGFHRAHVRYPRSPECSFLLPLLSGCR